VGAALLNADRRTDRRKDISRGGEREGGLDSRIDGQTEKESKRVILYHSKSALLLLFNVARNSKIT
jgi:hypothetical protein